MHVKLQQNKFKFNFMVGNCTKILTLIVLSKEKLMLAHTMQFTTKGLALAVLLMTFNACNFSQSSEKDLIPLSDLLLCHLP